MADIAILTSLASSLTNTLVLVDYQCVTLTSGSEQLKNYAVINKLSLEAKKSSCSLPSLFYQ